jgi:hypothetical protein
LGDPRDSYGIPFRESYLRDGTDSAVLSRSFVARSLREPEAEPGGLDAARGTVNAILISLVIWATIGLVVFALS